MTDDKKKEDKDRKKVSDEEMEDVAGGADVTQDTYLITNLKAKKKGDGPPDSVSFKPKKSGGGMDAVSTDPWDK